MLESQTECAKSVSRGHGRVGGFNIAWWWLLKGRSGVSVWTTVYSHQLSFSFDPDRTEGKGGGGGRGVKLPSTWCRELFLVWDIMWCCTFFPISHTSFHTKVPLHAPLFPSPPHLPPSPRFPPPVPPCPPPLSPPLGWTARHNSSPFPIGIIVTRQHLYSHFSNLLIC